MDNKNFKKQDVKELKNKIKSMYYNKYYNIWINHFKFNGIDSQQSEYIMKSFWDTGTVCAFPIINTDEIGLTQWALQTFNYLDFPEEVRLINKWNVKFMPTDVQVNNRDVVIGWIQPNHKPIKDIVGYYIERIIQIEMVLNTNINLHKMPFLIGVSPEDKQKAKDIITRILNDELVVYSDLEELQLVKSIATGTPYIIDKLYQYKCSLENELNTYMGIDNNANVQSNSRMIVDEINANNVIINYQNDSFEKCINEWLDNIKMYLDYDITCENMIKPITSVYQKEIQPSSKEGSEEDA